MRYVDYGRASEDPSPFAKAKLVRAYILHGDSFSKSFTSVGIHFTKTPTKLNFF